MEQSTWATFTGLESLKQVHSYGLDVTFSTGVWAVVQVYLQLLLIRDEAGFVQTFPLAVGNPCPLWGRANRALLRCLQPPAGRAVSLGHCCPPVELPGKAANPTNFGAFYGARQGQAGIFTTPSLSQSSWESIQIHVWRSHCTTVLCRGNQAPTTSCGIWGGKEV